MSGVQGRSPGTRANILSAIARGVDNRASPTRTDDAKTAKALGIGATVIGLTGVSAALGYAYVSSQAEKAAAKKAAEDAAAKKAAEEAAKKAAEEAVAKKAVEEAVAKKAAEEAAAKKAAEEAAKKAVEEAVAKKDAEEADAKKSAEEAAAKKAAEDAEKAEADAREEQQLKYDWMKRAEEREKATDQQTWHREAERIEIEQKAHQARISNADKVRLDLETVQVVPAGKEHSTPEGILAYYAERADLPSSGDKLREGPVYFVFERLCKATIGFWKKFAEHQQNAISRIANHPLRSDVLASFKETIELHEKRCGDTYDMWVAYVTDATPIPIADREKRIPTAATEENPETTGIEMAMTVLVDRTAPVTSHVGIFRPEPYWKFEKAKKKFTSIGHKSISILLYAFAAAAALSLYKHLPEKSGVMVARPVGTMGKALRLALGQEVLVGSQGERGKRYVGKRAELHEQFEFKDEDFSNDLYSPPLQEGPDQKGPGFIGFVDGKRMFGDKEHQQPEWMSGGNCGHSDFNPSAMGAKRRLTHTVLLSTLAQKWSASDTDFGRAQGARRRVRKRVPRWI